MWFLGGVETEFVVRLMLTLSPMVLSPFELVPAGFMCAHPSVAPVARSQYWQQRGGHVPPVAFQSLPSTSAALRRLRRRYILHRGVTVLGGELLTRGATWGEDIILGSCCPGLIRQLNAKSLNYAEVYLCAWEGLDAALDGFPRSRAHIHRCAVRLAMRRHFIRAAAAVRQSRDHGGQSESGSVGGRGEMGTKLPAAAALAAHGAYNLIAGGASILTGGASEDPPPASATDGPIATQKRAGSMKRMLSDSTVAASAAVTLQQQLINLRRSSSNPLNGVSSNRQSSGEDADVANGHRHCHGHGHGHCHVPAAADTAAILAKLDELTRTVNELARHQGIAVVGCLSA